MTETTETSVTESSATASTLAQLRADRFHRWLANAVPFASTDQTLPTINLLHITCDGTELLAAGTDRYVLGVSRYEPVSKQSNDGPFPGVAPFSFNITLADVATLLRTAKTASRDAQWRFVVVSGQPVEHPLRDETRMKLSFTFNSGETLTFTSSGERFPTWRRLFQRSGAQVARCHTQFNPAQLVKFSKVNAGDKGVVVELFSFHDDDGQPHRRPLSVRIGEHFTGLIMPVNEHRAIWVRPAWLGEDQVN